MEHRTASVPPEAPDRLVQVEAWLAEHGLKERERKRCIRRAWGAMRGRPDPVLCVSVGAWPVPVSWWL